MSSPEICVATVKETVDPENSGHFWAAIKGTDDVVPVTYVSPYASQGVGGFVAIPEIGTEVLITKPMYQEEWFFQGSILSRPINWEGDDPGDSPVDKVTRGAYEARGIPMRYAFRSPEGAGILIYEDENGTYKAKKTIITSTDGGSKRIVLDDASDAIVLESGNHARIRLNRTGGIPGGIEVDSLGAQRFSCRGSNMTLIVGEGGDDLTLQNLATGGGNSNEMLTDNLPLNPAGNVNLQSKHRDIHLITQGKQDTEANKGGGRIYICSINGEAIEPIVQLETRGSGGGVVIKTAGEAFVEADGGVNISTDGDIAMEAGGRIGLQAAQIDMNADGLVNIDGAGVNLAPGGTSPVSPNPAPEDKNQFTDGIPETN